MNLADVRNAVKRVISKHSDGFRLIAASQTQLLELASVTGVAEHYRSLGASVTAINPKGKRGFVVKTSTRGHHWNFSYFACELAQEKFEIRMNLTVNGAHDEGIYCVDVGIVKERAVPYSKPATDWFRVENSELITFAETKKLVVYPMLLAQFVGIVHEIKPDFLKPGFTVHLSPALITIGHLTGNSQRIVDAYPARGFRILIAHNYDIRLARVRGGAMSPFT